MPEIDDSIDLLRIRHPDLKKADIIKVLDKSYKIDENEINNLVVLTLLFNFKYPEFIKKNMRSIANALKWLHSDNVYYNFVKNDILNIDTYKFLKKCIYVICYEKSKMKYETFKKFIRMASRYYIEEQKLVIKKLDYIIPDSFFSSIQYYNAEKITPLPDNEQNIKRISPTSVDEVNVIVQD